MKTCKECRHWEDGECMAASTFPVKGNEFGAYPQEPIFTGPDFGCVLWEVVFREYKVRVINKVTGSRTSYTIKAESLDNAKRQAYHPNCEVEVTK